MAGYGIPTLIGALPYYFSFVLLFFYQTAAYAMGKHVPGGNLFPTVRTRRPTGKRVYLSIKRVCLPTSLQIYNRMRISADRSIERRPTVRLHRTLAPYCYHAGTTLPPTIPIVPICLRSTRPPVVPIRLLLRPTTDRAVTPAIHDLCWHHTAIHQTTIAPLCLLLHIRQ